MSRIKGIRVQALTQAEISPRRSRRVTLGSPKEAVSACSVTRAGQENVGYS